jgi:hypothetical protein
MGATSQGPLTRRIATFAVAICNGSLTSTPASASRQRADVPDDDAANGSNRPRPSSNGNALDPAPRLHNYRVKPARMRPWTSGGGREVLALNKYMV